MAQYEHCLKMNLLPIALWLNWEELSEVMPALSRNWYKLIRLNTSDPFGRKVWMYWGIINENIPKFKTRYSIQYDWKVLRKKVTEYIKDANSQKLQHGSNYTVCNNCGKICCCLKSEWYHAHANHPNYCNCKYLVCDSVHEMKVKAIEKKEEYLLRNIKEAEEKAKKCKMELAKLNSKKIRVLNGMEKTLASKSIVENFAKKGIYKKTRDQAKLLLKNMEVLEKQTNRKKPNPNYDRLVDHYRVRQ